MGTIRKRGQGLVEFAMVLPLLLLVFVGIAEFGRIFAIYANLFNAAREGARVGVVPPSQKTAIEAKVRETIFLVDPADVIVNVVFDDGPPDFEETGLDYGRFGERVRVDVRYEDLEPMVPIPFLGALYGNLRVQSQASRTILSRGGSLAPPGTGGGVGDSVDLPPRIEILDPLDGWTVRDPYRVLVWAFDDHAVTDVTLSIDGGVPITITGNFVDGLYYRNWVTTDVDDGPHTLQAFATDGAGYDTDSALVTVVVDNIVEEPEVAIRIDEPVYHGDTIVSGKAQPLEDVFLGDLQDEPKGTVEGVVDAGGNFQFNLAPDWLVVGHVIVVSYTWEGSELLWGFTLVLTLPVPTATPPATPVPGEKDIYLDVTCVGTDTSAITPTITVIGYDWPKKDVSIQHEYSGVVEMVGYLEKASFLKDFEVDISVPIAAGEVGTHTIKGYYENTPGDWLAGESADFQVPCATAAGYGLPNLVVESFGLLNTGVISTYMPLTFTVSVRNVGTLDVTNLFWVDLYAEIDRAGDISPTAILSDSAESVDFTAIGSLEAGASATVTLFLDGGFPVTGTHVVYALADSLQQVGEDDELDNLSAPMSITVSAEGTIPVPSDPPTGTGALRGSTYLSMGGDVVPQGRVNVYCYDQADGALIAETLSDEYGDYLLLNLPEGLYTVVGETFINDEHYMDDIQDIAVAADTVSYFWLLVLH